LKLDIPLAGWILSAAAFAAGTVAPFIYHRLSNEGFSVRQYQSILVTNQDPNLKPYHLISFDTVIKIANARKDSLILEDLIVPEIDTDSVRFKPVGVDMQMLNDGDSFHFPLQVRNDSQDQLPFLIHGETERLVQLALWFRYDGPERDGLTGVLLKKIENDGLEISFRLNSKNVKYTLHAKTTERFQTP
jgi:hypothetical protein